MTIWCALRRWDKVEQRAIYQPYILIKQLISVSAISPVQPQGTFEPTLLAYALPASVGAFLGLRVFHAITDLQFQRMLNLALVASGSVLLCREQGPRTIPRKTANADRHDRHRIAARGSSVTF
ncbi:MAG: hypothetical protein ACKVQU_20970 [Burkholderiales bacterium]